jgi:hypothetical protein
MLAMSSSIFNSEVGRLFWRIILPYLAIMGVFCYSFDLWFSEKVIFSVEDEGPAKMKHYLTVHDDQEVPIFGNSRTNNAIDPKAISAHSWNYGINGSDSELLRFLVENELASTRKTPIVIGIDPEFFFINRFGDALDYVPLVDHDRIWNLLKREGRDETFYRIPTVRYYGAFERYLHRYLVKNVGSNSFCHPSNGASLCNANIDPKAPVPTSAAVETDRTNYENVIWLHQACKTHQDRCFIFAELPFYLRIFLTENAEARFAFLRKSLQRLPNVQWIAIPDSLAKFDYFQNLTHLNSTGAEWYSQLLGEKIKALPPCP